jgi:glutaredoxin 3
MTSSNQDCNKDINNSISSNSSSVKTTILLFSTTGCVYCACVRKLLRKLGISFEQVDLFQRPENITNFVQKTNGRATVPQLFCNGICIGVRYMNGKKSKQFCYFVSMQKQTETQIFPHV